MKFKVGTYIKYINSRDIVELHKVTETFPSGRFKTWNFSKGISDGGHYFPRNEVAFNKVWKIANHYNTKLGRVLYK